jgi:hypothetical protein
LPHLVSMALQCRFQTVVKAVPDPSRVVAASRDAVLTVCRKNTSFRPVSRDLNRSVPSFFSTSSMSKPSDSLPLRETNLRPRAYDSGYTDRKTDLTDEPLQDKMVTSWQKSRKNGRCLLSRFNKKAGGDDKTRTWSRCGGVRVAGAARRNPDAAKQQKDLLSRSPVFGQERINNYLHICKCKLMVVAKELFAILFTNNFSL